MNRIFIFLVLILLFSSCKKEATVWQTDWSAPIINDTLTLNNLLNDSTLEDNGGFYALNLERTLFDVDINEVVELPDTTIEESFTISVSSLTLSPGFSFVNSAEEHELFIPDGVQLKKMILKEGFIDVTVMNPVPTNTIFEVTLPGASLGGVTFNQQYVAPPGTSGSPGVLTATIDLSGYQMDLSGASGADYNKLRSQITVATDPAGPTVTMTDQDVSVVQAKFRDVKLNYAQGYFGDKTISDTSDFSFEEMNLYQSGVLDLPSTSLTLELENGIKVSGEGLIDYVKNENSQGGLVSLSGGLIGSLFNMDPALGSWGTLAPSFKNITFNSANSNIEAYLENFGFKHELAYKLQLNPWGNVSGGWDEIFPNSRLRLKLFAQMPLNIGFNDLVLRDTFEIDVLQDPEKTRVIEGEIILNTTNAFPFSGEIDLMLVDASGGILQTISGTDIIQSAQFGVLDANSGLMEMDSELKFVLSEEAATDMNNATHIIVQSRFNSINPISGNNEQLPIPVGAFLSVKLRTNFKTENVL